MKGETRGPQEVVHKSFPVAPHDPYWLDVWTDSDKLLTRRANILLRCQQHRISVRGNMHTHPSFSSKGRFNVSCSHFPPPQIHTHEGALLLSLPPESLRIGSRSWRSWMTSRNGYTWMNSDEEHRFPQSLQMAHAYNGCSLFSKPKMLSCNAHGSFAISLGRFLGWMKRLHL
jgi:hypothetical protein